MAAPVGWVAAGTAIGQVGMGVRTFYNAAVVVAGRATPANVAVAVAAGVMLVNTLNNNLGILGQVGQVLLDAIQAVLDELQNLAAAYGIAL